MRFGEGDLGERVRRLEDDNARLRRLARDLLEEERRSGDGFLLGYYERAASELGVAE